MASEQCHELLILTAKDTPTSGHNMSLFLDAMELKGVDKFEMSVEVGGMMRIELSMLVEVVNEMSDPNRVIRRLRGQHVP
jgi:hypothetical protein